MRLDTHRLQTLDQVREFLAGSAGINLQPQRRADAYALVATILQRFDYALLRKADKGLLRRFLSKATGLSRAQVTRLLRQHRTTGAIIERRGAPRRPFACPHRAPLLKNNHEPETSLEADHHPPPTPSCSPGEKLPAQTK